ncbi:MAG: lipid IV(A) 3-deoxy-D-manno-octulosonic acid transferase [Pseudomonadales bacterium]|nr:lipid IV(A) 3-deoxy-D-manno-octulosonic acid transferase [Pseudomonadales bacterium]
MAISIAHSIFTRGFHLRWCYTLLSYLLLPVLLPRLWLRAAYRARWRERLGWYGGPRAVGAAPMVVLAAPTVIVAAPTVIFHAVSVGEVHAAKPLIDALRKQRPELRVVLTCTTPTGAARIADLFGDSLEHVYLPWDLPGAVQRFLARFEPALLVLLETELWPNLLRACAARACPVVLANARLSAKSQRGYAHLARLTRAMLTQLTVVVAQSPADGERFMALGLVPEKLRINGSLKFDHVPDAVQRQRAAVMKASFGGRPVWIAASTREGEEALVLRAAEAALAHEARLLLVLVPRHPERFAEAVELARQAGLNVQRASTGALVNGDTQVVVGDTMGELGYYYGLADVAFVGGSLVDTGCQNVIEPAAQGLPVLIGPSRYNFQAITDELLAAEALRIVQSPAALGAALIELLVQSDLRKAMGERGRKVVARNQGATQRLCRMLGELLS